MVNWTHLRISALKNRSFFYFKTVAIDVNKHEIQWLLLHCSAIVNQDLSLDAMTINVNKTKSGSKNAL